MSNEASSGVSRPQRKALGRGLSALLESRTAPAFPAPAAAPVPHGARTLAHVPVDAIQPNPEQPRKKFAPANLEELAASIRAHGLLQPVIVTPVAPAGGAARFQLVAGERRWRAAQLAGLTAVPALVQETPKDRSLEVALIENLQREDLNPIEAAAAFERLAVEFGVTHEEIAQRTGKDRATITNFLRLLRLPAEVQELLADGQISVGHAKTLLGLGSARAQKELATRIVAGGLSVRAAEKLVAQALAQAERPDKQAQKKQWDPNIRAALAELERTLGTRVRLSGSAKKGKLVIEYYSEAELMRIYDKISK